MASVIPVYIASVIPVPYTCVCDTRDFAIQDEYTEIVDYFHSLVATHPIILLTDGIGQVSSDHQERCKISSLDGIKPSINLT